MLNVIFERFVQESPVSVMMRGLMEHIFNSRHIDSIFLDSAKFYGCAMGGAAMSVPQPFMIKLTGLTSVLVQLYYARQEREMVKLIELIGG